MEFHMVLPSNSSPHLYANNKTSDFRVELEQRCELHGAWEMALLEVHYPNTLVNVQTSENWVKVFKVPKRLMSAPIPNPDVNGPQFSIDSPELHVNNFRDEDLRHEFHVTPGLYTTNEALLANLREVLSPLDTFLVQGPRHAIPVTQNFSIDIGEDGKLNMSSVQGLHGCVIYFAPRLAQQLGLPYQGPYATHLGIKAVRPIDLSLGTPSNMYVFISVIENQIVGHSRVPLLRTVPITTDAKFGSMSVFKCEHPIYHAVSTKSFGDLEINIKTDTGHPMPFVTGTSILVCHFRQRASK